MATTTVYTYSTNTHDDSIRFVCESDGWQKAVEAAADAEENTFELAQMLHSEDIAIDFIQHHRVIFFDSNGNGDALGVDVPKVDKPTKYRLYIGMIGEDFVFADESESCESLVSRFEKAMDKTHALMSIIAGDFADDCKKNVRGVIISTTDRNFIEILK